MKLVKLVVGAGAVAELELPAGTAELNRGGGGGGGRGGETTRGDEAGGGCGEDGLLEPGVILPSGSGGRGFRIAWSLGSSTVCPF